MRIGTNEKTAKTFRDNSLCITSKTNIASVNFLDITLTQATEPYKPYRKPNTQPLYIDKYKNHPRHIIKTLPDTISKRITELCSTKKDFEEAAPFHSEAMKQAKYDCHIYAQKKINRQINGKTENVTSFGIIRLSTTKFRQM